MFQAQANKGMQAQGTQSLMLTFMMMQAQIIMRDLVRTGFGGGWQLSRLGCVKLLAIVF
jgi:hypothetical protein